MVVYLLLFGYGRRVCGVCDGRSFRSVYSVTCGGRGTFYVILMSSARRLSQECYLGLGGGNFMSADGTVCGVTSIGVSSGT